MNKLKYLLLLLPFLITTNSQTWQSYSSMKETIDVDAEGSTIWVASTGGAFYYDIENDTINTLTQSDGLSSSILTSLAIDKNGYIWFGTQEGNEEGMVNVYDPSSKSVKEINDIMNSNYSQKTINSLTAKGDTVFVATDFGISLLDISNYTFYDTYVKFGDFASLSQVKKVYPSEKIYLVTENGVAEQRSLTANLSAPESWISYELETDISVSDIYDIVEYQSQILLATDDGIYYKNGSSWERYLLAGTTVTTMQVYDNKLYLITSGTSTNSIFSYNSSGFTTLYQTSASIDLNGLYVYDNSTIFAASSEGLLKITDGSAQEVIPDGPEENLFSDLVIDSEGTLWVATGTETYGIGIFSYNGNSWTTYNTSNTPEFSSNAFFNAYIAPDNTIYFGNWGNAFTIYKNGEFTNYFSSDLPITGIPGNTDYIVIDDFCADSDGNIWILNYSSKSGEPLSVLTTDGDIENFSVSSSISSDDVVEHLIVDQYDTKWFGVTDGTTGLFYFNDNGTLDDLSDDETGRLTESSGLISNDITALALDDLGSLWVGTNTGVTVISNPSSPTSNQSTPSALKQLSVTCIEVDPINRKWVGTTEGVIVMSEDGSEVVEQYTSSNSPLPSNQITSIAIDDNSGTVYIATEMGIASVQTGAKEALESFGDELFIYPNPVVISGDAPEITIDGLVKDAEIKIISISGKLIKEISSEGGRLATWDGRDTSGKFVASGVYIIVAYDEDGSNVSKGKVAIIRN